MKHDTTTAAASPAPHSHRVCPWFLGYLLVNPLRRLLEPPERLLAPFVEPGMTVLEPGCGMGFFTLPVARMVGPTGRVLCVDVQEKMLGGLRKRAERAGLGDRIDAILCTTDSLGVEAWNGRVDLALLIHVLHEVPDGAGLLRQIYQALRPGGRLLIVEPKGHVTAARFAAQLDAARAAGFLEDAATIPGERLAMVLERPEAGS